MCFQHLRVYEKPQSQALHQCTCVQQPLSNYLKGVEHHSGLIWTITAGFIYHQGKQATVHITEKAARVTADF